MHFLSSFCVQSYAQSQWKNMFYFRTTQIRPILEINFIVLLSLSASMPRLLSQGKKRGWTEKNLARVHPHHSQNSLFCQKYLAEQSNIKKNICQVKGMDTVQLETSLCIPLKLWAKDKGEGAGKTKQLSSTSSKSSNQIRSFILLNIVSTSLKTQGLWEVPPSQDD